MAIIGIPLALITAILSLAWILALPVDYSFLSASASLSSLTLDGIECETREHSNFHIHSHLDIFINGEKVYSSIQYRNNSQYMSILDAYPRG
jgi:hypothetical protein